MKQRESGRRVMRRVLAMALVSVVGLVGMLLSESLWDWPFFACAVLPLALGTASFWRERGNGVKSR